MARRFVVFQNNEEGWIYIRAGEGGSRDSLIPSSQSQEFPTKEACLDALKTEAGPEDEVVVSDD